MQINSCLRYCKSTIFQANHNNDRKHIQAACVVCDTAKVRFFKQITTVNYNGTELSELFAILQKYDFSSKSQRIYFPNSFDDSCLRYCKSTIFQANHNRWQKMLTFGGLFAILQKYGFSSKSQLNIAYEDDEGVVCDTAKVRFFKQITT